jgi:hypothetical protein
MSIERFQSSPTLIFFVAGCVFVIGVLGHYEMPDNPHFLEGVVLGVVTVLLVIAFNRNTFIEIREGRTLINSGFYTFMRPELDVRDIKYVYRIPAFLWRSWGSLMVIYIKGDDGRLRQTTLREVNYTNDTLRRLLQRLKALKPTLEFDPEYEAFLRGEYDDDGGLNRRSENTVASLEARLREKGETWDEIGSVGRFLDKFK